jgi:hypothetical protein
MKTIYFFDAARDASREKYPGWMCEFLKEIKE